MSLFLPGWNGDREGGSAASGYSSPSFFLGLAAVDDPQLTTKSVHSIEPRTLSLHPSSLSLSNPHGARICNRTRLAKRSDPHHMGWTAVGWISLAGAKAVRPEV